MRPKAQNPDATLGSKTTTAPTDPAERDETLTGGAVYIDDAEDEIREVAHDVAPEDFDFAEFVSGARPGRRAVTLTMRSDLIAEMELIIGRLEAIEAAAAKAGTEPDEAAVNELAADYQEIRATYEASRRTVIVEARSTEWLRKVERDAKKHHGLDAKKNPADGVTIMLRQIAGQIVHPTQGVTVEALRRLSETSEPEIDKLFRACRTANASTGVAPDFSQSRSATTRRG
ncbi:hypothetical protein V2J56_09205 [Georgenia sp. MJ206]|uniref:hypothetical protein n=1 Tax=Georgenia wangjunii TaxID=3117730 RepID=UPI002F26AEEC